MQLINEGVGSPSVCQKTIQGMQNYKNRTKLGNWHNLVLIRNRTKPGTALNETVLIGDSLYLKFWTREKVVQAEYRKSPISAVSFSAVPGLVRFQISTKLCQFPSLVRFL